VRGLNGPKLATLALLCLSASACGVPGDSGPRALDPADIPADLLAPSTSSTSPSQAEPDAGVAVEIWMVDNDGLLVPVRRRVTEVSTRAVIDELLTGATQAEADRGLHSEIPTDTSLNGIDIFQDQDVITVDLSSEITNAVGDGELLAQAQLVYTVTPTNRNVDGVLFLVDGEPREGTDDAGVFTAEPLGRSDFSELVG